MRMPKEDALNNSADVAILPNAIQMSKQDALNNSADVAIPPKTNLTEYGEEFNEEKREESEL